MPKSPTARLGIPRYEDSETAAFSFQVNAISEAIDAKALIYEQGVAAARPSATTKGRLYFATDTKALSWDTGTAWEAIGALSFESHSGLVAVKDGQFMEQTKEGAANELPAPGKGKIVGVWAAKSCTIAATAGAKIFGDFLSSAGVTNLSLGEGQHVVLMANAAGTGWLIVSGEPKREATYSRIERAEGTEYEPSATQRMHVLLEMTTGSSAASAEIFVNGERIAGLSCGTFSETSVGLVINPGQKWRIKMNSGGGVKCFSSYLPL